jgi:hypothetical protein
MNIRLLAVAAAVGFAAQGCTVSSATSNADKFREALPLQEDVALNVPASTTGGGVSTKSLGGGGSIHIDTPTDNGGAQYYQFTREITGAVDFTTGVILGGIWAIVHTEPTSIDENHAVWGPGSGNALDPAIWRFTVTALGNEEYSYVLEGQSKAGGAFLPILNGHGYGSSRPEHRSGWFLANNDNYKTLEPTDGHDTGTTKITFDLTKLPATIDVELRPVATQGSLDINVSHEAAGAGLIDIKGTTDIDPSKATKLEDVHLISEWNSTGAGRGDVVMSGGDLPLTVNASECWSSAFARTYYKDTVNYEPASGDSASCAFSASQL